MIIRDEEITDFKTVFTINTMAFHGHSEANLVEVLRKQAVPNISLVAEDGGTVVGYILFAPVTLTGHAELKIIGLAPVAVLPEYQGNGIGSSLIKAGLERCREAGFGACVVLGHKEYYPRFGFTPSVNYGIKCEYDVPPEVFMIIELQPGYLHDASGTIQYNPAFNDV